MKPTILLLVSILWIGQSHAQNNPKPEDQIRMYWFVMLTKGPNRDQPAKEKQEIQKGHMANMDRLYKEGKLKVAGPFGDDGEWQGIFIFDCKTKEEVIELLKTDPAIKAGRLNYILKPWYTAPIGSFIPGLPQPSKT